MDVIMQWSRISTLIIDERIWKLSERKCVTSGHAPGISPVVMAGRRSRESRTGTCLWRRRRGGKANAFEGYVNAKQSWQSGCGEYGRQKKKYWVEERPMLHFIPLVTVLISVICMPPFARLSLRILIMAIVILISMIITLTITISIIRPLIHNPKTFLPTPSTRLASSQAHILIISLNLRTNLTTSSLMSSLCHLHEGARNFCHGRCASSSGSVHALRSSLILPSLPSQTH